MLILDSIFGHTFFKRLVPRHAVVLDLGANVGGFASAISKRYGSQVYSVEANPAVYERIAAFPDSRKFNFAIAGSEGMLTLHVHDNSEASTLQSSESTSAEGKTVEVLARRLEPFVSELGLARVHLLKMDIEGAEIDVLANCSDAFLQTIDQLSIEFHDFCDLVTRDQVDAVIQRLTALGFRHIVFSRPRNGHTDTLFVNISRCRLNPIEFLLARWLIRDVMGVVRMARRLLGQRQPGMETPA